MTLNRNGQAITLSSDLQAQGVSDGHGLKRLLDQKAPGSYTFAHTFPTGTHAMWLYYWLANTGSDPFADVRMVNIIGDDMEKVPGYLAETGTALHLYGKAEARASRKMGHVNQVRT